MNHLFAALPTYNGQRLNTLAVVDLHATLQEQVTLFECSCSLLARNFNIAWTQALNERMTKGITHFLLLHADVSPRGSGWITTLLHKMERTKAKVLSVVLPLKSAEGVVSTALDDPDYPTSSLVSQFTTTEIHQMPEETFTHERLLANTGCLLVDFREPWV